MTVAVEFEAVSFAATRNAPIIEEQELRAWAVLGVLAAPVLAFLVSPSPSIAQVWTVFDRGAAEASAKLDAHVPAPALRPFGQAVARGFRQLELHRPPRLLLHHHGAGLHFPASRDIADADRDHVSAAQLAVYRQIEQREVSEVPFPLKVEGHPSCFSGHTCFGVSGRLAPTNLPTFHGRRLSSPGWHFVCPIVLFLAGRNGRR